MDTGRDVELGLIKPTSHNLPSAYLDPVGLLGTKAFLCPPFLVCRK